MIKKTVSMFNNANTKNKRLIYSTIFNFLIKGFSVLASLLLLPLYMKFFPDQKILGLWFTALSVLSWVLVFDLGIGNGLRNKLVESLANNDVDNAKKYVSSAYIMVGAFVFIVTVIGYFLFDFVNWHIVFNVSDRVISSENLLLVTRIIFIGIMLQFFLKLITSLMYALKKPVLPGLLSLISTLLLLGFLYFSTKQDEVTNLINLAYANVVLANIPLLIITLVLFNKDLKYCMPSFKSYDNNFAKSILKLGGVFFAIQVAYLLITNTSEFLITMFTKPEFVVEYKIYYSLFSFIGTIFSLALIPIWSEVTEAFVKGEVAWMKRLYIKLYKFALLGFVGLVALLFLIQFIVDVWLKRGSIQIDYRFSIVFLISGLMYMWNAILSSFANGMGKLRISVIYITIGAIINIPITFFLTFFTSSWIVVIIANILSMIPFCLVQTIALNKYFKSSNN